MLRLQSASLDWALKHIEKYGDTDIFPVPFEFQAIREFWDSDIKPWIRSMNLLEWELRPYRRLLTPKNRYGFRISTQLDPIDSIIFTALVFEIGRDIEKYRIDKNEKIAFSYRFKPETDGRLYDPAFSWESFQQHSLELANSNEYEYVLLADIADFYPRIYSHPLEQALNSCTRKKNHVIALKRCFKQLNGSVSYGIPVGQSASRLIAELILNDIDQGLIAEEIKVCRYVDDFRIFTRTEREAIQSLGVLANLLFENQGLTLQQHKTKVLSVGDFKRIVLKTEEEKEIDSLEDRFTEILNSIDSDMYDDIDFDELEPEIQVEIDRLNLEEILKDNIEGDELDIPLVRFIIGRLAQINKLDSIDVLLMNIEKLYPVFKDVMKYFQTVNADSNTKRRVGGQLLRLINDSSIVGHLEFNRMWLLNSFTCDNQWDNEEKFITLYNNCHDEYSQRKLILALGRSHKDFWFKSKRRYITQFNPWVKRAFLAASSCLPGDQAEHWYKSIPNLDTLDRVICNWALQNKF
ncbi:MAG: RNA-directed DNA polymerase [Tissierellia bacterium]|nr:RNA-directed DNA polymerase [Tissierellia bacterium]